jgi:MFS family permease
MAIFVINATIMGTSFSFGVFFKSLEAEFSLSRATTSSIFSAYLALSVVFSLLGGWALDKYGPRIVLFLMGFFTGLSFLLSSRATATWQLFITYSLLLALGAGAIYVVTMPPVMRWFERKRGLAVGIAISGGGLGQVVMAPLATFLIITIDWRFSFIALGLISWLLVVPLSRLLKRDPSEIGALPDGVGLPKTPEGEPQIERDSILQVGLSLWQALKARSFWLFTFFHFLLSICMLLVVTHIVPHATDIGFSAGQAAIILSLIGGTNVAGTILIGTVSDKIGRKKAAIISSLLMAGAMLWLIWARELWMLYLFALFYGFVNGGIGASATALIGDTLGMAHIGKVLGALEIGWGVGAAIGPIFAGLIFDIYQSYSLAFLIAAIAMFIVAALLTMVRQEIDRASLNNDRREIGAIDAMA